MGLGLLATTAKQGHKQHEQVAKDVVDIQIDRKGCTDVVGFSAVYDSLQVVEQKEREDDHGKQRNSQHERGHLQPNVCNRGHDEQDDPDEQKLTHAKEDNTRSAGGKPDELGAVTEPQRKA